MDEKLIVSGVRDFRIKGAPLGTVVAQSNHYYAWWSIHEPDMLHVMPPDGEGLGWIDLRLDGWIDTDDGIVGASSSVRLDHGASTVEAWGGGGQAMEELDLVFAGAGAADTVACHVHLRPRSINVTLRVNMGRSIKIKQAVLGESLAAGGSHINARRLFNPCPASHGVYHHPMRRPQMIRPDWFTPSPFAFAFELDEENWMSVALESKASAMPYTRFTTRPDNAGAFGFAVEYDSMPEVGPDYISPPLVFRFGATDETGALRHMAEGMVEDGTIEPVVRTPADWWRGVMACGWHQQVYLSTQKEGGAEDHCTQAEYEAWLDAIQAAGIEVDIITIDAGWSRSHGLWEPHPDRWPDLKGFIERQHAAGRRVLLWISTDTHDLPESELYRVGERRLLDPLNEVWRKRLEQYCRDLLGTGDGQIGADGFKFDYTDVTPPAGRAICTRELHGLDYLHALFSAVSEAARGVRSDVLLDFQIAHPAFAALYDMSRLNDYFLPDRQAVRVMRWRAAVARAVGFGALVDVDGPGDPEYFRTAPSFGNPSLYVSEKDLDDEELVGAIRDGIATTRSTADV